MPHVYCLDGPSRGANAKAFAGNKHRRSHYSTQRSFRPGPRSYSKFSHQICHLQRILAGAKQDSIKCSGSSDGEAITANSSNASLHQPCRSCKAANGHAHSHAAQRDEPLANLLEAVGILRLADFLGDQIWVAVANTGFLLLAFMSRLFPWSPPKFRALCITAIFVLGGVPEVVELLLNVTKGRLDTHVLMTLACFGTLAIGSALEGALLLVLFQVSHTIEHVLSARASSGLQALLKDAPELASLVDLDANGLPNLSSVKNVPAAEVLEGSNMLVRPGEQIALDGEVVYGEALVSSEHVTGEALPVRRRQGDEIPAGALNHDGLLVIRAVRKAEDSMPARIAKLTNDAQAGKPEVRRWVDDFGEIYVRGVLAATVVSFLVMTVSGIPVMSQPGQKGAMYRALGLMTTASPCALVLVPLAYVSSLAVTTRRGILIRGSKMLDALVNCSVVAFDKTGTLTTGQLSCTGLHSLKKSYTTNNGHAGSWLAEVMQTGSADDVEAIASAVSLSEMANHPVARATAAMGSQASLPKRELQDFKSVAGAGVEGTVEQDLHKRTLRFGTVEFALQGVSSEEADPVRQRAESLSNDTVVSLLVDRPQSSKNPGKTVTGLFTFSDTVQAQSRTAIQHLQSGDWDERGRGHPLKVTMLTGDNVGSATKVANALGIDAVQAGLTPERKLQSIQAARGAHAAQGHSQGIIMVGDGINDAPALAAADVGIAVTEKPSDAAAAVADVLLLRRDGIAALPFLLKVAHKCQRVVKQNLVIAAAAILALSLPVLTGLIPVWIAVAFHEGSTLLVALNSLRLLYTEDELHKAYENGGQAISACT